MADLLTLFDLPPAVEEPAVRPDAPAARLVLPAGAPESEWHRVRREGIGGSDVAAILGLDKYRGPLHVYEAKHGRDPFKGSEAAEIGTEIESFVARLFSKRSGMAIANPPGTLASIEHPWALANVDKYVLWDKATHAVAGPLEVKNRSEYQLSDWEDDNVPDAPAIQGHWYTAVGGWDVAWVAALVGGNKLRWSRLERDEELVGYLLDYCGRWYERHVLEGFPPEPGGLESTKDLLAKLWSVKPETIAEVGVAKAKELRARHIDLKAQAKAIADKLTAVENEMRQVAGESEIVQAGGKPAWSWKQNGTFVAKRFREEYPELAARYVRTVEELDLDAIKAEQPDAYNASRARVLRVPAKGI